MLKAKGYVSHHVTVTQVHTIVNDSRSDYNVGMLASSELSHEVYTEAGANENNQMR